MLYTISYSIGKYGDRSKRLGASIVIGKRQGTYWDGRYLLLLLFGFLMGRVWFLQINPFGVAVLASVAAEKKGQKGMAFCIMAGMFTSIEGILLLKYFSLFLIVLATSKLYQKWTSRYLPSVYLALLTGGLNMAVGILNSIVAVNTWELFWLSILESIAVLALANIYQWGIHFFLYEEWSKMPSNEELISVLAILVTAFYGIPRETDLIFSISGTLAYLMILFMGYRYGASTGAIAGAAGGILLAITGESLVAIGIACLLGVCAGTFRRLGRIASSCAFLLMGGIMMVFAIQEVYGVIELRAMLSAAIIFLALPKRVAHCIEEDMSDGENDSFAREDIRSLANHRLEDFSDAFRRLSRSFENEMERRDLTEEELEELFEELSRNTCQECINCKYCWNRHYEKTNESLRQILWQAGREGAVSLEVIDPDFHRRCMHLEEYVGRVEEKIAGEKVRLGWHNRMTENRRVMAEQMKEIATALKSFTVDLGDVEELPREYKRRIHEELKREGVKVQRLSVKRRRKYLEVMFTGSCQGNQCLTKTDVAQALYRATGIMMCPARETRNVLSSERDTMFFREDTKYKALTGLARIAKSGETVSGDNYSFLELSGTGELLMVLADGMGSGEMAYRDSGNLIEALEYLMEAGFEKKSALRLLNTLFVVNYEGESFTTLDMTAINLYTGQCEIMKNGAATTFVRRADRVDMIASNALPVGVDLEAEPDVAVVDLQEGDMIIMVSDGVLDGFYERNMTAGSQDDMATLIENLMCQNPNDMANQILMNALARSTREATDDMSVLVAGIWNKN